MFEATYDKYVIRSNPKSPTLKYITPPGSGKVPKELQGNYTSVTEAQIAINTYNSMKPKKEVTDGNKADTSKGDESVRKGAGNRSKPASVST